MTLWRTIAKLWCHEPCAVFLDHPVYVYTCIHTYIYISPSHSLLFCQSTTGSTSVLFYCGPIASLYLHQLMVAVS